MRQISIIYKTIRLKLATLALQHLSCNILYFVISYFYLFVSMMTIHWKYNNNSKQSNLWLFHWALSIIQFIHLTMAFNQQINYTPSNKMLRAITLRENNKKKKRKLEGSIETKFKSKNKFEFSLSKIRKKEKIILERREFMHSLRFIIQMKC